MLINEWIVHYRPLMKHTLVTELISLYIYMYYLLYNIYEGIYIYMCYVYAYIYIYMYVHTYTSHLAQIAVFAAAIRNSCRETTAGPPRGASLWWKVGNYFLGGWAGIRGSSEVQVGTVFVTAIFWVMWSSKVCYKDVMSWSLIKQLYKLLM